MGAELEKERFGARRVKRNLWIKARDRFQLDVLSLLSGSVKRSPVARD
jgi:hypothetical protein